MLFLPSFAFQSRLVLKVNRLGPVVCYSVSRRRWLSFNRRDPQKDDFPNAHHSKEPAQNGIENTQRVTSPNSKDDSSSLYLSNIGLLPQLWSVGTKAVLGATAVVLVALASLYINQEKLLYIPQLDPDTPRNNASNPPGYKTPSEYDLPFEEHWIRTEDGVEIHTWLLLQASPSNKPTIVFFHGNAGNIGIRLPNAKQMYDLLDSNVLMVEYRGYGDSLGSARPTEAGLKLDGQAAVQFIQNHPKVDSSKIFLFGRSLGGAVAFHVARTWQKSSSPNLAGIMVENTFCSIDEMADILFPFLAPVKGPLLKMHWNSKDIARSLDIPILYLAGEEDEIVPHSQMKELYQISSSASRLARFYAIPTGTHNDTWIQGGRLYWSVILEFVRAV